MTKRLSILLVAVSVIFIFGCGTSEMDPVTSVVPQQLAAAPAGTVSSTAAAEAFTTNVFAPIDLLVNIPCANGGAGEDVTLSGFLHSQLHVTINGNNYKVKIHDQPQGIRGVGTVSGNKYQGTGVTQETLGGSLGKNGSFSDTYINNFRMIGQKRGNNFIVHEVVHVTLNAKGVLTVFVDHFTTECK